MDHLINNWRRYIWAMWLGGATSILFDTSVFDFRFWLLVVPTMLLVSVFNDRIFEED